jgi:hypothetical protein
VFRTEVITSLLSIFSDTKKLIREKVDFFGDRYEEELTPTTLGVLFSSLTATMNSVKSSQARGEKISALVEPDVAEDIIQLSTKR